MLRQVKTFLSWHSLRRRMLLEAIVYLAWANLYKRLPFSKVSRTLGKENKETPLEQHPDQSAVIREIAYLIELAGRHVWWEPKCLAQAIAAMKMLSRRGIESTLYLGTARESTGRMIAHAWLRSGNIYVTGSEQMARFTLVGTFATLYEDKQGA